MRAALPLLLLCSCVTTVVEDAPPTMPSQQRVEIPLPSVVPSTLSVDAYYESVVGQMQQAVAERDIAHLQALLAAHDDARAPAWARARMLDFRDLIRVLEFEERLPQFAAIELQPGEHALGAELGFAVTVQRWQGAAVELGAEGSTFPANVLVSITLVDRDPIGSRSERRSSRILAPADTVRLHEAPLHLPFRLLEGHGGAAERTVSIRAELLPGRLSIDGVGVPNRRVLLGQYEQVFYPAGVAPIQEKPLQTLRNALALGDAAHFPHVFLAASFMPEVDRPAAAALLIERLRLGRADQARSAMAALQVLTGESLSVDDRESWLRWWQSR